MLKTGEHVFEGTAGKLKYRFSRNSSDRHHLLVIFSGFRAKGTLDFGRALDNIHNNILWIYDEFGDNDSNTYYYMANGSLTPRNTIDEFLESIRLLLHLSWKDISLAGFSKGGSAAIYYGLRNQAGAVIATVPQTLIGRYAQKNWPAVFDYMRGPEDADQAQEALDAIIPNVLSEYSDSSTNIYVLTSPADSQYEEELIPYLEDFKKLQNFNLLVSESPLITQHVEVTPYNVPVLVSLFQLTANGLYPKFGEIHTSVDSIEEIMETQRTVSEGVANVEQISAVDRRLDLKIATFIRGVAQPNYGSTSRELLLRSEQGDEILLPLGKKIDTSISRRYVQDTFIDYRAASSTTPHNAGYALSALPVGKSSLFVIMKEENTSAEVVTPVTTKNPQFRHIIDDSYLALWNSDSEGAQLENLRLNEISVSTNSFLSIDYLEIDGENKLHVRGWFAPIGTKINQWGDAHYYVMLTNNNRAYTFRLGHLDKSDLVSSVNLPQSMGKAYVCDIRNEGIDLSSVQTGDYEISLLCLNQDVVVRSAKIGSLIIDVPSFTDKPLVGVMGSCVVRDVFNSRFIKDWHNRNHLVGAAHQSNLVSLASAPFIVEEIDYSDLDNHSAKCVDEDLSKSVVSDLVAKKPKYVFIDLFSDARFGVKDINGFFITDNAWKLGKSKAYKTLEEFPKFSVHTDPKRYLELFERSARDLYAKISAQSDVTFVLVKVRATENLRNDKAEVHKAPGPAKVLNNAFTKLEPVLEKAIPDLVTLDMTDMTVWADKEHPWSAYVVHYEQRYYDALDRRMRALLGTERKARIIL